MTKGEADRRIENLPKLLEEAAALAMVGAREKGVTLRYRIEPGAGEVLADKVPVQQVVLNLMRNAIDAMEQSAERNLTVGARPAADAMVEVYVADTGPGLAPEVSARLFEPFLTTKKTGMGVGLSISRTIVEAHGGRIWAEPSPTGEPSSGSRSARHMSRRRTPVTDQIVHVVDDDEAVRASLAFVLDSAGRGSRTYASAEEFLEACGPDMIGCVVTDVRMAEINGIELVRRLQMLGVTMPVIVMTGHGDVSLAVEAMKAGVMDFLEKPFDDEIFLRAVESALNSSVRTAHEDGDRKRFQAMLATLSPRETEVLHGVVAGIRTRRSPATWASVRARSRSTAPM